MTASAHLPQVQPVAEGCTRSFIDRSAYAATVLQAAPQAPIGLHASGPASTLSYVYGFLGLAIAALIAAVTLFRHVLPERAKNAWALAAQPLAERLSYLHSGQVGDYVTWQAAGLAILGAAVAFCVRSFR